MNLLQVTYFDLGSLNSPDLMSPKGAEQTVSLFWISCLLLLGLPEGNLYVISNVS
jgi:hypothetical protein